MISDCQASTPIAQSLLVEVHECGCVHVRLRFHNSQYLDLNGWGGRVNKKSIWWIMDEKGRPFRTFAKHDLTIARRVWKVVKPLLESLQGEANSNALTTCPTPYHRLLRCPKCHMPVWLSGKRWLNTDGTVHKDKRR